MLVKEGYQVFWRREKQQVYKAKNRIRDSGHAWFAGEVETNASVQANRFSLCLFENETLA